MIGMAGVPVGSGVEVGNAVSVGISSVRVGCAVGVVCISSATIVWTMAVCAAFGSNVGTVAAPPQAREASHKKMTAMMGERLTMVLL